MGEIFSIEKRGQYWCLLSGNRIVYKSKDEQKVRSRYDGQRRSQENQLDREIRARNYRWI